VNIPHQYQLFTAAESRELDRRTIQDFGIDGFTLMEIAGTRAADFILNFVPDSSNGLILCGRGNNAGDALVVARILAEHRISLDILFVDGVNTLSTDCEKNHQLIKRLETPHIQFITANDIDSASYQFIIDGMLGTGLNSEIRSPYKEVIEQVNKIQCTKFAMDIPSGMDADDGNVLGSVFKADFTFAFGTLKKGFYWNDGYSFCGEIIFCELPFPSTYKSNNDFLLHDDWLHKHDSEVTLRNHKYDGGVVYIIGGSEGLTGAAILASLSAWNTGVGAVVLITPKALLPIYDEHLIQIIKKPVGTKTDVHFKTEHLEETRQILSEKPGVLLIGPGLGRDAETVLFVQEIIKNIDATVVMDADALFAISKTKKLDQYENADWILTPHPGELHQLADSQSSNRLDVAKSVSESHNAVILSKGLPSIVISPTGSSITTNYDTRIFSRAGFGDVLAGKVAGYQLKTKNRELACCLALSDGKSKAIDFIQSSIDPLEPMDII